MGKKEVGVIGAVLVLSLVAFFVTSWTGPTQAETPPMLIAVADPTPTPTAKPSPTPTPKVGEGCTPGFWKNHTNLWVGFSPGQTLESVFDVPDAFGLDSATLLQALSFGGGSGTVGAARTLSRDAVAALLNASALSGYSFTVAQVISLTNAGYASNDRTTMLNQASAFNSANNLGCPLR